MRQTLVSHHPAALGKHSNGGLVPASAYSRGTKGQGNALNKVRQSQAVGTNNQHTIFSGDATHFQLRRLSLLARLGESGSEHHYRANATSGASPHLSLI